MKKFLRRGAQVCAVGTALFGSHSAMAATSTELLDILLKNGAINQEQYDQLVKGLKDEEKDQVKMKVKDGQLKFSSGDDEFEFHVGGRLMVDSAWYQNDKGDVVVLDDGDITVFPKQQLGSGTEIRRARLQVDGKVWNDWKFKTEVDFAGDVVSIKDAYLEYTGLKQLVGNPLDLKAGNFKEPFSLEELTSSRFITFMERALINEAFVPSRNLGFAANSYGPLIDGTWTATAGIFGQGVSGTDAAGNSASWGPSARVTFAPVAEEDKVIHVGGSFEYRNWAGQDVRVRTRPESHVTSVRLVSTTVPDTEFSWKYGAEAAAVWGPFSLQGEYVGTNYTSELDVVDQAEFDGFYAFASWFITGESRHYDDKKAAFERVKPKSIVGKGGYGAWEVAARYSYIDLNSGEDFNGGLENNYTFGVNWYATPSIRFMANYIIINSKKREGLAQQPVGDNPGVFQIRGQIDF